MYDLIIIGAGVVGCALAAEATRFSDKVLVLEKKFDVCEGSSKANSGIVHAGYDAKPGTNKAKFNLIGAKMMEELSQKLKVPYKMNGALVLGFDEEDRKSINSLLERAKINGVENCELIEKEKILEIEPNINQDVNCALWVKNSAIISPYELTYAFADIAKLNSADFVFGFDVKTISFENGAWSLSNGEKHFRAKAIAICAGVFSDELHNQISDTKVKIQARRGEYYLLDHEKELKFKHTIFQVPNKMGKGVLVSPTTHGNIILGPSAEDIDEKDATETVRAYLDNVLEKTKKTWPNYSLHNVITTFSGIRAHELSDDFIIGEVEGAPLGAFEAIGIESPGLSASPAIAKELAKKIKAFLLLDYKKGYIDTLDYPKAFSNMSWDEKREAYRKNSDYGRIICRCEQVTEAEIRHAINRPVGATSIDGVKRRTRAGMGRCQGGFCSTRIAEILSEELNVSIENITKFGGNSRLLVSKIGEIEENK